MTFHPPLLGLTLTMATCTTNAANARLSVATDWVSNTPPATGDTVVMNHDLTWDDMTGSVYIDGLNNGTSGAQLILPDGAKLFSSDTITLLRKGDGTNSDSGMATWGMRTLLVQGHDTIIELDPSVHGAQIKLVVGSLAPNSLVNQTLWVINGTAGHEAIVRRKSGTTQDVVVTCNFVDIHYTQFLGIGNTANFTTAAFNSYSNLLLLGSGNPDAVTQGYSFVLDHCTFDTTNTIALSVDAFDLADTIYPISIRDCTWTGSRSTNALSIIDVSGSGTAFASREVKRCTLDKPLAYSVSNGAYAFSGNTITGGVVTATWALEADQVTLTASLVTDTTMRLTRSPYPASGGTGTIGYRLQQAPDAAGSPGTWADVSGATGDGPWDLTLLTASTTYWFRVAATDTVPTTVTGPVLSQATTSGGGGGGALDATGVTLTAGTTLSTSVALTKGGTAVSGGTSPYTYQLQYKSGSGSYANYGSAGAGPWTVTSLTPSTNYDFIVHVTDAASGASDGVPLSITTNATGTDPVNASALVLTHSGLTSTTVTISMGSNVATGGSGTYTYQLQMKLGSGSYANVGTPNASPWVITGLTPDSTYYFRVSVTDTGIGSDTGPATLGITTTSGTGTITPTFPTGDHSTGTAVSIAITFSPTLPDGTVIRCHSSKAGTFALGS